MPSRNWVKKEVRKATKTYYTEWVLQEFYSLAPRYKTKKMLYEIIRKRMEDV